MTFKNMSNFHQRMAVGGSLLILTLIIIYFSNIPVLRPFFTLIVAGVAAVALAEYFHLANLKDFLPKVGFTIAAACLFIFAIFLNTQFSFAKGLPELALLFSCVILFLRYFSKGSEPLRDLSVAVFGFVYVAIPLACLVGINYFSEDGRFWLLYLLAVTKLTDMGAYFIGKKFGKRKLAPYISPKKTWEGAVGGLLLGVSASIALHFISPSDIHLVDSIWLGLLLSLLGQIGDLSESLLKRDAGTKDSSKLPGLGGALDTIDSLVFASPMLYIFLKAKVSL